MFDFARSTEFEAQNHAVRVALEVELEKALTNGRTKVNARALHRFSTFNIFFCKVPQQQNGADSRNLKKW